MIVLPKMRCTCVWAAGVAAQHDDQCAQVYSYPECKSSSVTHGGSKLKLF